jgi:4-hydroxy-3-methylbut-2-enyl diphosphate reductase
VTELRQEEAARLAAASDMMIVIGSPDSSNSTKLYEISRSLCPNTVFLTDPKEAPDVVDRIRRACPPVSNLSITAGASTPFSLIQEVLAAMNENTENFAELLESSFKTLNTGEIVEGVITAITGTEIHVDLGAKTTGVIARDKATDDPQAKLEDLFKVGDTVRAKVVKVSDVDGIATLDKTRVDSESNWDKIVEACETQETLTGKIVEAVKGGVIISLNSVRVFIPASLTGIPKDGDLNAIVGTDQKVKIIEIKPERRRAYASIRAVQREERKAREEAFWNNIAEGMEFDGEVKSLTDFGAFVDLGGVDGMVHTSELSWRRIRRPSDVVSVGDKIHVYVKGFDRERGRISLGYKTEEMNPWYIFTQKYQEGDTAEVKIVSLMPFGAFAEIVPGCDGLIHISQIADHKIAKPDEVLAVGDIVNAKITQIDNENHKVSLSIRQLLQEAARAAEEEEYEPEETVEPEAEEAPAAEEPTDAE